MGYLILLRVATVPFSARSTCIGVRVVFEKV